MTKLKSNIVLLLLIALNLDSYGWVMSTNESVLHLGTPLKKHTPNSFVVSYETQKQIKTIDELNLNNAQLILSMKNKSGTFSTLVLHKQDNFKKSLKLMDEIAQTSAVQWISPDFEYEGDPREIIPNDPMFEQQQHHKVMKNIQAWDQFKGDANIIVAVTDDGVQTDHEDLAQSIWINEGEIPHNGIDDDENGYIDDSNGWDFSDSDNNPSPFSGSHGTHVAGIIAAERNNSVGLVGTAPEVTIMPLRFYGGKAPWTASLIAKTYAYAVNNGAKIINTSYKIDQYAGDPVYEAGIAYAYSEGLLIFNSAGNAYQHEPRRVKFEELILVASTKSYDHNVDQASSFTNYGHGVDISAPGDQIYSTVLGHGYKRYSGTSMAAPNAAAVAAAVWSKFPHYSRDQVAAVVIGTSDPIDHANNEKYHGKLGTGRVNTLRAITELPRLPKIINAKMKDGHLLLHLNGVFDATSISNSKNWKITSAGNDTIIGTKDDVDIAVEYISDYKVGTNFLKIKLENVPTSQFKVSTIKPLLDPFLREVPTIDIAGAL